MTWRLPSLKKDLQGSSRPFPQKILGGPTALFTLHNLAKKVGGEVGAPGRLATTSLKLTYK